MVERGGEAGSRSAARPGRPRPAPASRCSTEPSASSAMEAARSMRATSPGSLTTRRPSTTPWVGTRARAANTVSHAAQTGPRDVARPRARATDAPSTASASASRWAATPPMRDVHLVDRPRRPPAARRPGSGTGRRWSAVRDPRSTSSTPADPVNPVSQRMLAGVGHQQAVRRPRPESPVAPTPPARPGGGRDVRPPTAAEGPTPGRRPRPGFRCGSPAGRDQPGHGVDGQGIAESPEPGDAPVGHRGDGRGVPERLPGRRDWTGGARPPRRRRRPARRAATTTCGSGRRR